MLDSVLHGRRFMVLDVIKGVEARDTITVWNGTDFDCNGPWSLSAEYMGSMGDTLLASLTPIDTVRESWQVLGDYVRTYNFGYTPELRFSGDTLHGMIAGYYFAPPQTVLWQMAYTDFVQYWNANGQTCNQLVGINEAEADALHLYPNPVDEELFFSSTLSQVPYALYNLTGGQVKSGVVTGSSVNLKDFASGVYFLEIETSSTPRCFRLVKK